MAKRAGALRHRIDVLRKNKIENDYGGHTMEWEIVDSPRCDVYFKKAREAIVNDQEIDLYVLLVDLRRKSKVEIRETDRVKYEGSLYSIEFIQPTQDRRWRTLTCSRLSE